MKTWRSKIGLYLIALALAAFNGEMHGALTMLGAWLIWDGSTERWLGDAR